MRSGVFIGERRWFVCGELARAGQNGGLVVLGARGFVALGFSAFRSSFSPCCSLKSWEGSQSLANLFSLLGLVVFQKEKKNCLGQQNILCWLSYGLFGSKTRNFEICHHQFWMLRLTFLGVLFCLLPLISFKICSLNIKPMQIKPLISFKIGFHHVGCHIVTSTPHVSTIFSSSSLSPFSFLSSPFLFFSFLFSSPEQSMQHPTWGQMTMWQPTW